jgi:hypothetical protein
MLKPRTIREPRPRKPPDPNKAVSKPPRLKPTSTRVYGKGGTPLSSAPDFGLRGAGIGFGDPEYGT